MESAKQRLERLSHGPFVRLVRHCVDRIFSGSEGAEPGELDLSIATILALLATPGAFVALFCMDHYGSLLLYLRGQQIRFDPYAASASDEYFFIALSMVVAGAVAVWKWDRLVPDHRDYANLAPLPIASSRIFLANLTALSLLAITLSLDVNAVSAFLFPLVVCAQQTSHVFGVFLATHALAIVAASAFGFLAVFALLGILMALLPYRAFRKASIYARCGIVLLLMALLATSVSVPRKMQHLRDASRAWMQLPPPAWFLGLCQILRGQKNAALTSLGGAAIVGLLCALLLSLGAYWFCYARCFAQSAEITADLPAGRAGRGSVVFRLLDALFLRSAFQRACYRFAFRTIFRNEEQAFALGGFVSLGIVIASQAMLPGINKKPVAGTNGIPSVEILSVPLIMEFFLILGLWSVCAVPAPLRANWVFRFHVNSRSGECLPLARKIILTFIVPALAAVCLPVYSHFWGWRVGVVHTALVAVWCVLLMEGLLTGFRKIPFTCSLPKFKSHSIVSVLLLMLGYFAFTSVTATVESWALADPYWFTAFVPVVAGVPIGLCRWRRTIVESDRRLIFEERSVTVVEVLNLGG
ncbi:MAG: hypothetical protein WA581_03315 [Candidatus Acidiferrales bacterium]